MTTIASQPPSPAADRQQRRASLVREIKDFFRLFFVAAFRPYRPEQHYMRGPGPACQAKRDPATMHRHLI